MEETGRIYKIISGSTDKIYIGSTVKTIEDRLSVHESGYKSWINSGFEHSYCTSYEILKYSNYQIIIIEEIKINNKSELWKLEGFYQIENYYNCVNSSFSSSRPRKTLVDTINERYTCYCVREIKWIPYMEYYGILRNITEYYGIWNIVMCV